ncbi:hypothetical protein OIDMADRAFT_17469 [Oidiodendron maius Zn]|uniref:Uncharacterized protein n=1 Tax=Oidiodendron maius (strain Zn) TaxID=913774 RepID=A0A0C3H821_OIDMZ|nr:hypothetical protein OIDMADRAFT_17469 [Oidiodendron maius Zn]
MAFNGDCFLVHYFPLLIRCVYNLSRVAISNRLPGRVRRGYLRVSFSKNCLRVLPMLLSTLSFNFLKNLVRADSSNVTPTKYREYLWPTFCPEHQRLFGVSRYLEEMIWMHQGAKNKP